MDTKGPPPKIQPLIAYANNENAQGGPKTGGDSITVRQGWKFISEADQQQLQVIRQGGVAWNNWRIENLDVVPDLRGADLPRADLSGANLSRAVLVGANLGQANLSGANLSGADLSGALLFDANLSGADLSWARLGGADLFKAHIGGANLSAAELYNTNLSEADLSEAYLPAASLSGAGLADVDLTGANLFGSNLEGANLSRAVLVGANLGQANLSGANLSGANLHGTNLAGANLSRAILIATNLEHAILADAKVYGVSVWDVRLENAVQTNLVITEQQPEITVDNLEVAQFIYLLLNNSKIRNVIDTITSKAVLILGRFADERKTTLDALRDALRSHDYLPILFDFEKPTNRDFTETVSTLAHLARFVIADLTDPRSIPQELTAIIPRLLSVPIRPLLLGAQSEWAMFSDLKRFPQVIPPLHYTNDAMLLSCLERDIIAPAEQKARELSTK